MAWFLDDQTVRNSEQIEHRTSNVQHRMLNIDDALRGVGATTPISRRLRFIDFKTSKPQPATSPSVVSPSVVNSELKDSGSND